MLWILKKQFCYILGAFWIIIAFEIYQQNWIASQLGDEDSRYVCFQCPGGIGVPDDKGKVGNIIEHHAVVHHVIGSIVRFSIDGDLDGAEGEVLLQVYPCCWYDEVCVNMLPTLHLNSILCDVVNVASDDGGLTLSVQTLRFKLGIL